MARRPKTADDYYDDEYAKEKGKLDARRDAREREARWRQRASGGGCGAIIGGCLVLIGLFVGGIALFTVMRGNKEQPAVPSTRSTAQNAPPTQSGANTVPAGARVLLDAKGRLKDDTVAVPDGKRVLLGSTFRDYLQYIAATDDARSGMEDSGKAFYVEIGTHATVAQPSKRGQPADEILGSVQVTISEGPSKGKSGHCFWRFVSLVEDSSTTPDTAEPGSLRAGKPTKSDPPKIETPEIPPENAVTLTASKAAPVLVGQSRQHLTDATDATKRAKHLKSGELVELTEPTAVELVYRGKDVTEVKWKGKGWVVESQHVPAGKK